MIQTLAFRNINIFFLIQTYGSYIYTVQKIILRPARPVVHNCYDWGRPVVAGGDAGGGKGWVARNSFLFFSSFPFGGGEGWWIYTHLAGGRRSVHCFLDTVHSTPPPIHGPSFSHSVAFSLDRHHAHAHTINYILFLSFSLSLPSARTLYLSFFLARFSSLVYSALLFRYSFFLCFFFPPFNHLHSRAFMFVVLIFSNI